MPKAVRFDRYGGTEVLYVAEVDRPVPAAGQVLVRVRAAAINPGEAKIRAGALHDRWPATFPEGQGSDLAGVVVETGPGVDQFKAGDEVLGYTDERASHAELVAVKAANLTGRPADVPWEQAGSLYVVGTSAVALMRETGIRAGDVVVVSAAAGGVGTIAVQLARNAGAMVIGLASAANHQWLTDHGVTGVCYGDGAADRIRAAAGGRAIDAFIDTYGAGYPQLALDLGVTPDRIATIADFAAGQRYGVKVVYHTSVASAEVLAELAGLISAGKLDIPVAASYSLDQVQDAYSELEKGHTRGKIVLKP